MLIRFHTFEDAGLFVAMKRAEGFFARVIHQNAGHFYGPMAVNGFAVIVSEEAAAEGEVVPEVLPAPPSELAKMVAMFGLLGMVGGVPACALIGGLIILHSFNKVAALPVNIQLAMAVSWIVLGILLWVMLKFTRIYRQPEHQLYRLSQFVIRSIGWLCIIL